MAFVDVEAGAGQLSFSLPPSGGTLLCVKPAEPGDTLARIAGALLAEDIPRFEQMLEEALRPQEPYLTEAELSLYRRGKRVRPIMLLLSARLYAGAGPLPDKAIMAAVSLEMLHVATLIHDDIIDEALLRRGLPSVNAARGTNVAILVGDMQFVQAIRTFVDAIDTQSEMGLVKLVLDTAFRICAGELDELHTNADMAPAQLRERVFQIIERKTAIMFGLASETGMALVGGRTSDARRIGFYGRRVGRAFQIVDDLFDFLQSPEQSGKTLGIDLARRRLSLPLVYGMEEFGPESPLSRIMRGEPYPPGVTGEILRNLRNSRAITRAYADARTQAIDALEYLKHWPASPYREALEDIALYTVDRPY